MRGIPFLIAALLFSAGPGSAGAFISEFLAINKGPDVDDLELTSDWIEIHNPDATAVELSGWTLTDEPAQRAKWTFPAVTIPAGGYLVIGASGMDRRTATEPLHTNFTLSGSGEFLGLYPPAGNCASCFQPYPKQFSGYSYGRAGDGATGYLAIPTRGSANAAAALTGYTLDTHFNVERGFYSLPFTVALTCDTPGAMIRYTTDGSQPDESSALYASPVNISATATLRARAFSANRLPSNTDTQTYIFPSGWATQPAGPASYPATMGNSAAFTGAKDRAVYGMSTAITDSAAYSSLMLPALTQTLPVLCITGRVPELFGDASIQGDLRSGDAEVAVGVEFFNPLNTGERFAARGSLQAHGGAVRDMAKKGFRIDFSGGTGDGPVSFPLFAGAVSETFDQLVLRPGGHDSYTIRSRDGNLDTNDVPFHASYLRDQFLRRTENEAGLLSPRGRYVHLCLNGLYWGLYDLHERPNAEFFADRAGGNPAEWDVLHHSNTNSSSGLNQVVDGTDEAWDTLQSLCSFPITTNAKYNQLTNLLGPERYIDHLLIRMWGGDHDWLGPVAVPTITGNAAAFNAKNWYAVRNTRTTSPGAWRFFTWDGEITMGNHLLISHLVDRDSTLPGLFWPAVNMRKLDMDFTGIAQSGTPAAPWNALRAHPEFRLNVADRAQRLLFNGGLLSPQAAAARVNALISELDLPMVAETARWGAAAGAGLSFVNGVLTRSWTSTPQMTRNTHWRPEVAWIRSTFAVQRAEILRDQLRARGLFPHTEAPPITLTNNEVSLSSVSGGTIYFTLNGADPRVPLVGSLDTEAQVYTAAFAAPSGRFTVNARVQSDTGEWSPLVEKTFTTAVPPTPASLAITEVYYHPTAPSADEIAAGFHDRNQFEFLEITNVSNALVALETLRFAAGIDFDFAENSTVHDLSAGASLVLASNSAAFALRFGNTLTPAGIFQHGTKLSNNGERIKLVTRAGAVIAEFNYDDEGTWPAAVDGGGHALELLAPFSGTSEDDGDHWRSSLPTPGSVRSSLAFTDWLSDYFTVTEIAAGILTAEDADPDGDSLTNLMEYYTRLNPRRQSSAPVKLSPPAAGGVRFTWERRSDASGITGVTQISSNLESWINAASSAGLAVSNVHTDRGTVLQTLEFTPDARLRQFVRLKVTRP